MNWIQNRTEGSLIILGLHVVFSSIWLLIISESFGFESPLHHPPVVGVVAMLVASAAFWLLACWLSSRLDSGSRKRMLWWIVGVGIVSRAILLGSTPIIEIDLYRYIWDGNVTAATGAPYKYAPNEFNQLAQLPTFERSDEERAWINEFASKQDESMRQTLQVLSQHFGQYTSPYPPVSQAVFAIAHICCPDGSSLKTRVIVMKTLLTLFDIATGIVLILILRTLKMPETMSIVWFWSPLVLKEFANSGHLDSIAVFFCSLFVLFTIKQISNPNRASGCATIAAISLSLGIAAKIYPVVLIPLWAIVTLLQIGKKSIWPFVVLLLTTGALLLPMASSISDYQNRTSRSLPKPGVQAFAESWEMNDFLFMFVVENLKPNVVDGDGESRAPWFVVVPESWRSETSFSDAFLYARTITMLVFLAIVMWLAWRWTKTDPDARVYVFAESVFIMLAWFWLLSPTQNPWYWCWALPFVPFAKSRLWYLIGATTLLYYLRPWYTFNELDIAGFDHIVPVIEFAPILILLFASFIWNRSFSAANTSQNGS